MLIWGPFPPVNWPDVVTMFGLTCILTPGFIILGCPGPPCIILGWLGLNMPPIGGPVLVIALELLGPFAMPCWLEIIVWGPPIVIMGLIGIGCMLGPGPIPLMPLDTAGTSPEMEVMGAMDTSPPGTMDTGPLDWMLGAFMDTWGSWLILFTLSLMLQGTPPCPVTDFPLRALTKF